MFQLPFGRECIAHYKLVKRLPVFSHEELLCKMAADPDSMDLQLAAQTHHELLAVVEFERLHRKKLLDMVSVQQLFLLLVYLLLLWLSYLLWSWPNLDY